MATMNEGLQEPSIYVSKKRVWIKYNRKLLCECFGLQNTQLNYGVVSLDFFKEFESEIYKSFENDLKLALFEKKQFGKTFIRVLNQDIISKKHIKPVSMNSKTYKSVLYSFYVFGSLKCITHKIKNKNRTCVKDTCISIFC